MTFFPSMKTVPWSAVSSPAMIRSSVDLPLPLGPRSAVSDPGDLHRDVVERDEVVEPLRDAPDGDRHQCLDSFGWRKIMATRMMTAVAARTKEMP